MTSDITILLVDDDNDVLELFSMKAKEVAGKVLQTTVRSKE